jgi:hypothetical protein
MSTPQLLTAAQVADILGLHPKVIARHTRQGRYSSFALNLADAGSKPIWRYDPRRLEKWLEARRSAA